MWPSKPASANPRCTKKFLGHALLDSKCWMAATVPLTNLSVSSCLKEMSVA